MDDDEKVGGRKFAVNNAGDYDIVEALEATEGDDSDSGRFLVSEHETVGNHSTGIEATRTVLPVIAGGPVWPTAPTRALPSMWIRGWRRSSSTVRRSTTPSARP